MLTDSHYLYILYHRDSAASFLGLIIGEVGEVGEVEEVEEVGEYFFPMTTDN